MVNTFQTEREKGIPKTFGKYFHPPFVVLSRPFSSRSRCEDVGRASDQFEAQLASPHELEGEAVNAHAVASCCFFGAQVVK